MKNDVPGDKHGGQPEWPTHEELVSMATTLYNRLKRTGHWDMPKSARSKAYNLNLDRQCPTGKQVGPGFTRNVGIVAVQTTCSMNVLHLEMRTRSPKLVSSFARIVGLAQINVEDLPSTRQFMVNP